MQQSMERSLAIQSTNTNVDPEQLRTVMNEILDVTVGFGAAVGVAIAAGILIGAVKLWRGVYWYLVITYLIPVLALPQDIVYTLSPNPLLLLPSWGVFITIPF